MGGLGRLKDLRANPVRTSMHSGRSGPAVGIRGKVNAIPGYVERCSGMILNRIRG